MSSIVIVNTTIEIEPSPKERPRMNRTSGNAYTPAKTKRAQALIGFHVRQWMREHKKEMSEKALMATLGFWFQCPEGKNHKDEHTTGPDVDNCCKLVLDALNLVAYKDDAQIVHLSAHKGYWKMPSAVSIYIVEKGF
jgi:Holliday junction resolvase RusA-like endonuclease